MFIWLGAGRARRRAVGPAGRLLDQAAQAGLPVPAGAVLLDEFYRFALGAGLARAGGGVVIPDPELWHNTLHHSAHLPRFPRPVAVSVIPTGDDPDTLQPGDHSVDFNDAPAAARAVAAAWSRAAADTARRDVLILETVATQTAGLALTTDGAADDTVTLSQPAAGALALPQLHGRRGPDGDIPPYARRLQQLMRGARRTFGRGVWRIRWADDGHICWLVGVCPAGAGEVVQAAAEPITRGTNL